MGWIECDNKVFHAYKSTINLSKLHSKKDYKVCVRGTAKSYLSLHKTNYSQAKELYISTSTTLNFTTGNTMSEVLPTKDTCETVWKSLQKQLMIFCKQFSTAQLVARLPFIQLGFSKFSQALQNSLYEKNIYLFHHLL
jgi:hypothetical protein